jgi:hypothetical protein
MLGASGGSKAPAGLAMAERLIALAADPDGAAKRLKEIAEAEEALKAREVAVTERERICANVETQSNERFNKAKGLEARGVADRQRIDHENTEMAKRKAAFNEALQDFEKLQKLADEEAREARADNEAALSRQEHADRALSVRESALADRESRLRRAYEVLNAS